MRKQDIERWIVEPDEGCPFYYNFGEGGTCSITVEHCELGGRIPPLGEVIPHRVVRACILLSDGEVVIALDRTEE